MSRGKKTRTEHLNILLTPEEYKEFHMNTLGYGEKANVVRLAIASYNKACTEGTQEEWIEEITL